MMFARFFRHCVALLMVMLIAASSTGANAVQRAQNQQPLSNEELRQIERQLKARRREESRLKDEAEARDREVKALRNSMIETANALQSAESRIADINVELARLEKEAADADASLRAQRANLGDVLAGLQSLERSRPPALLVSPDDAAAAARAAMLLADAAPELEAKASEIRVTLDRLESVQNKLTEERANRQKTNDDIDNRRQTLASLLTRKQEERDVAQRLAAAAQSETAALAARASNLRGVLDRLNRLARSIVPRLKPPPPAKQPVGPAVAPSRKPGAGALAQKPGKQRQLRGGPAIAFAPGTPFTKARGRLKPPVIGDIVGRFGQPQPDGEPQEGIRINAAANAIVTAPFEASVVFARFYGPAGNLVVLDVGAGYHILLIGVGTFLVEEGQTVAAGEPIGVMPGENSALDFEIRRNREPVNPSLWLSGKTRG